MDEHSQSSSSNPQSAKGDKGRFSIGRPLLRVEDERLLRGGSRYVSDLIATSTALRLKVLRSPHAHARLVAIDASSARTMPGIVAVLTVADLDGIKDLPCDWAAPGMDVTPLHPVLARDRVRYVGEPVVAVAAETVHAAEDALAQIKVNYEQLPAIADQEAAMQDGAPRIHDAIAGNIAYRFRRGGGKIDSVLASCEVLLPVASRTTASLRHHLKVAR
jgi:carbon-monoxide dehydrogenase large subunit